MDFSPLNARNVLLLSEAMIMALEHVWISFKHNFRGIERTELCYATSQIN